LSATIQPPPQQSEREKKYVASGSPHITSIKLNFLFAPVTSIYARFKLWELYAAAFLSTSLSQPELQNDPGWV
jgi:hypothetical protein